MRREEVSLSFAGWILRRRDATGRTLLRGKSDEIDGDARRWGGNFTDRARRNLKGIINAPRPP